MNTQEVWEKTFNEIAAEVHDECPLNLERLVVLLTSSMDKLVYVAPEIAGQVTKDPVEIRKAVKFWKDKMRTEITGGHARRDYDIAGTLVRMVAINAEIKPGLTPQERLMEAVATFDHEIAHHLLRHYYASHLREHVRECAADIYSVFMHIKRFGKDTSFLKNYAIDRAQMLLGTSAAHYTSDAVERAIGLADEKGDDFFKLSPRQMANMAADLAADCALGKTSLEKIYEAFKTARETRQGYLGRKLNMFDSMTCYRNITKKILAAMEDNRDDPRVLKAGKRMLGDARYTKHVVFLKRNWQKDFGFITAAAPPPRSLGM